MAMTDETQSPEVERAMAPTPGNKLRGELVLAGGAVLPATMKEASEVAQYMSKAKGAIPDHLVGNVGGCLAVIMDATSWGMNPFAVARMHMNVHGVGSYMAQLISAVIKQHAPVKEKVWKPIYTGEGLQRRCQIIVHHAETGEELEYTSPIIGPFVEGVQSESAKGKMAPRDFVGIWPKNSPLWRSDPDQQLYYYTIRGLARRHFSGLMLGVYDPEEAAAAAAMRDITPKENLLNDDEPAGETQHGEVLAPGEVQAEIDRDHDRAVRHYGPKAVPPRMKPVIDDEVEEGQTLLDQMIDAGAPADEDPDMREVDETGPAQVPMTEEAVVSTMLGNIANCYDQKALDAFTGAQAGIIRALKPENSKRVRKAISDRSIDLEEP